jgi:hypothetical protein
MKKLILPLILMTSYAYSAGTDFKEISDTEIRNRMVSIVKDVEVEKQLNKSSEFAKCRDKNKFDPKTPNPQKLADATKCFRDDVLKGKSADELKKLADTLQLESYGLIKSKNVNDITEYLSNKMIKSLTGRDPKEKNLAKIKEQLKFENQKFVDQSVFIELYVNQLGKSALHEVSRFCFENLRNSSGTGDNFQDHWASFADKPGDITNLKDDGSPKFQVIPTGMNSSDLEKSEEVFNSMVKGITQNNVDADMMKNIFSVCQAAIKPLCDDFKKTQANDTSQQQDLSITAGATTSAGMSKGANACLTASRLQSVRAAMAKSKLLLDSLKSMSAEDQKSAITLTLKNPIKMYERGQGKGEETMDEISSMSSTDLLAEQDSSYIKKMDECAQDGTKSGCDDSLGKEEDYQKALHKVEMESNLKREIEIARIEELKKDKQKLQDYLKDNGYFELLEKFEKNPNLPIAEIESAIKDNFNAKKVATIEALKSKVGSRQVSENASVQDKADASKNVAVDAKEERARLAQVVLFNNIITSHLELRDKDNNVIGRNVNAWLKEGKGLKSNSKYNTAFFQGLQDMAEKEDTSKMKDASIIDVGIIDTILGKTPDP